MAEVEGSIAGMSGSDLQRSFLMAAQRFEREVASLDKVAVSALSDESVANIARDLIIRNNNLSEMAEKISLELGIPITF